MNQQNITAGINPPEDINIIIEIPANHTPIKYEVDKSSSAIFVDRFMATPMFYPANYGYIPHTLADDGDPLDALVITPYPLIPGSVIRSRPVGVLHMKDEAGVDAKLLCVPHAKLTEIYNDYTDISDVPVLLQDQINHFFEHYKELEKDKWVKIDRWAGVDEARKMIMQSLANQKK